MGLGFYPEAAKGGVGVAGRTKDSGPAHKRHKPDREDEIGTWWAEPGQVITHVNGYAVTLEEELLCAVSAAKNRRE